MPGSRNNLAILLKDGGNLEAQARAYFDGLTASRQEIFLRLRDEDKLKIVVNKEGISTITVKNVANLLEATPVLVVPYDLKAAMLAVNRGIPMLSCAPNSKASKAIREYARALIRRV